MAVKVGIYFTANAAAQKFFQEQLYPFYQEIVPFMRDGDNVTNEVALENLITPDLTAWGDTKYDATNTTNPFTCTEGPNQCYINRFFVSYLVVSFVVSSIILNNLFI